MNLTKRLVGGIKLYRLLTPNPLSMFRVPTISKWLLLGTKILPKASKIASGKSSLAAEIGDYVGSRITLGLVSPFRDCLMRGMNRAAYAPRRVGRRSWIHHVADLDSSERAVVPLTIVYHHANKAGKHIDVHIGQMSFVMRVDNKPVEKLIAFNSNGRLTTAAANALLEHVRGEIRGHSRVPQNLDHSLSNASFSWLHGEQGVVGYGEGPTRQVLVEDWAEFYHLGGGSSLHMYAPTLFGSQSTYIYQIYDGRDSGTPIAIWGLLTPKDRSFGDRLHLRLIQDEDFEDKFLGSVHPDTLTRKYDGASGYFDSNSEGTKFFSPRYSKVNGHRIEYTWKLAELSNALSIDAVGMGEIMFWHPTLLGVVLSLFNVRGPEGIAWNYLSAAEIGGILNANMVRRSGGATPEFRLYRVDRIGGKDVGATSFAENRTYQHTVAGAHPRWWVVVRKTAATRNTSHEGIVAVPPGLSVNDGLKIKWWGDTYDWRIDKVDFAKGPKGSVAGVIRATSLESGRTFNLGPGQFGNDDLCRDAMEFPDRYEGAVMKVASRTGHEGRASKRVDWHLDK